MTDFSSFFPTAGGGGGFSKMNKYSTIRALADATYKAAIPTTINVNGDTFPPATVLSGRPVSGADQTLYAFENSLVGCKFTNNATEHTVTANANNVAGSYFNITFTPALTGSIANNVNLSFSGASITVNPATDLSLSDGDSLGILLCGGGDGGAAYSSGTGTTGKGGRLFYKVVTISNASTNLVLTPGIGYYAQKSGFSPPVIVDRTESTITGGLTLTSADGQDAAGIGQLTQLGNGMQGIDGYGAAGNIQGLYYNGFGTGGYPYNSNSSGTGTRGADGAILLYY